MDEAEQQLHTSSRRAYAGSKFPLPPFIQSVTWRELKGHPLLPPIHTAVFVGVEVRLQMTDMEVQA